MLLRGTNTFQEHPSYTLSALLFAGGAAGFIKKRSIPSLVAGLTFSTAYAVAGYLLHKNADWGLEIALGSSALLFSAGGARGLPSRFTKPVPVVLTTLGLAGTLYYAKKYNEFYPLF